MFAGWSSERDMWWLPTSVTCWSICCLSHGHILTTKLDRPVLNMEHLWSWYRRFCCHIQILPQIPLEVLPQMPPALRCPPLPTPRRYFGFMCWKLCANINTVLCSTLALDHSCCQLSRPLSHHHCCKQCDTRNLLGLYHIGHRPYRPQPYRPQTISATTTSATRKDHIGQNE